MLFLDVAESLKTLANYVNVNGLDNVIAPNGLTAAASNNTMNTSLLTQLASARDRQESPTSRALYRDYVNLPPPPPYPGTGANDANVSSNDLLNSSVLSNGALNGMLITLFRFDQIGTVREEMIFWFCQS